MNDLPSQLRAVATVIHRQMVRIRHADICERAAEWIEQLETENEKLRAEQRTALAADIEAGRLPGWGKESSQ